MTRKNTRALARMSNRPSADSDGLYTDDPITVGPGRSITIDMAKLPSPSNVYDADFAWAEHRPGDLRIFFAKRNRDEPNQLRSRLELRYPPENLVRHFWSNSRDFHERLNKFAAEWPIQPDREHVDPAGMKSNREHSEWANFDAMAHAGTEAVIDFFNVPASGVAKYAKGQGSSGLRVVPIVRVQTTVFELKRLLDSLEPIVAAIREYLPKRMAADEHQDAVIGGGGSR